MTVAELRALLSDARDLGVSMVALAGGEPLTRPEIVDVAAEFPELLFPLVTNGSLLDDSLLDKLQKLRNVIPVISLEGLECETDARRGRRRLPARARRDGPPAGSPHPLRRLDHGDAPQLRPGHQPPLRAASWWTAEPGSSSTWTTYRSRPGRSISSPARPSGMPEPLTMMLLRSEFRALFVASAASEAAFGGCMAAGEGFVHVSAEGDLEPCPFSPFSDTNLREVPLRVALQSRLLRNIRESGVRLSETNGGCALWAKRDWVQSMTGAPDDRPTAGGLTSPAQDWSRAA